MATVTARVLLPARRGTPRLIERKAQIDRGFGLGYAEVGDPDGHPVLYFHGIPGSRLLARAFDAPARACGARIVALERPGCGLSDYRPAPTVADCALVVGAVADGLGIERFSALGVSGGGPYALACGRLYPERIDAVGLVSSVGSEEEPGVLLRSSRLLVALGRMSPRFAAAAIAVARRCPARRPEGVLKALEAEFAHDGVDAPEAARLLLADLLEAFSSGGRGVAADCARVRRWGFDPEEVRVPVYLWHGREDTNVSVAAARRLAARLPSCRARFLPGEGHFGVLPRHGREIVKTLVAVASGCFRCTQIAALMSSS